MLEKLVPPCAHPLEVYQCQLCYYSTNYLVKFTRHSILCDLECSQYTQKMLQDSCCQRLQPYKCGQCNFTTHFFIDLSKHTQRTHVLRGVKKEFVEVQGLLVGKTAGFAGKRKRLHYYQCAHCPYVGFHRAGMKQHLLMRHTPDDQVPWYKCDQCDYKNKIAKYLKVHKQSKHGMALSDSNMVWHRCEECAYITPYKSHMKVHKMMKHTVDVKWFQCEHCPYKTKQKSNLKVHVKSKHTREEDLEMLQCTECGYKTRFRHTLRDHLKTMHSDELEWFYCDQCVYRAKRKTNLGAHYRRKHMPMKKSESETIFHCDECALFSSRHKNALQRHKRRQHGPANQIKWFACDRCQYRSMEKAALQRHSKTHDKPKVE